MPRTTSTRLQALTLLLALASIGGWARDVPFDPSPEPVVRAMLELAEVRPDDVVYDLGSGDGRIVIAAARDFGARAVGIDIDPRLVAQARANARAAGVEDRVRFVQGDLFEADLRPATVVTLFLLQHVNLKLRPKLLEELAPGTRVVSHVWTMGDWVPEAERYVEGRRIYLWRIPGRKTSLAHARRARALRWSSRPMPASTCSTAFGAHPSSSGSPLLQALACAKVSRPSSATNARGEE